MNRREFLKAGGAASWLGVALAAGLSFADVAPVRPVAVAAAEPEAKEIIRGILRPAAIVCASTDWLAPSDYGKYAAVYIGGSDPKFDMKGGWSKESDLKAVQKYLDEGGTIILGKGAPELLSKGGLVAEELLMGLGKGGLLSAGESSLEYKDECERKHLPLTLDGANGENIVTEEGRKLEALRAKTLALFKAVKGVRYELRDDSWGKEPLGKPGDLRKELDALWHNLKKPAFRPRPQRKPGLVLVGKGPAVQVFVPRGKDGDPLVPLAEELAWHLGEMSGGDIRVVRGNPAGSRPAIVVGAPPPAGGAYAHEQTVVRREGNRILIGGEGSGVSHGVTYVLEALGCRYLWPGRSGKVIPRRNPLVLPELALDFTPRMHTRVTVGTGTITCDPRNEGSRRLMDTLRRLGVDPQQYADDCNTGRYDRVGNRDFWRWHGVCDNEEGQLSIPKSKAPWKIGHFFGDFWPRYGATHPEWFALQMNGSRYQHVGSRPNRPTLCLSNDELARETAKRVAEMLKVYTWKRGWTIGLPDGGATEDCMCRKCRELDPPTEELYHPTFHDTTTGRTDSFDYPPLTDRYLVFANRVLGYLRETNPGAELTFYAYNSTTARPSAVRPAKGLICCSTSGNYTEPWQLAHGACGAIEWSHLCPVIWRPNILWTIRQSASPQNFAKALGRDIELMKLNGLVGTHFDCMGNEWSQKGLSYYMMARTLLNPDELSPEDIVDDYCEAGFGKAAGTVKAYFEALEKSFAAAVGTLKDAKAEAGSDITKQRLLPVRSLTNALDTDALLKLLERAKAEAAGDEEVVERIRFLEVSCRYAVHEKRLVAARLAGDDGEFRKLVKAFGAAVANDIRERPFAFCPVTAFRGGPFLREL